MTAVVLMAVFFFIGGGIDGVDGGGLDEGDGGESGGRGGRVYAKKGEGRVWAAAVLM